MLPAHPGPHGIDGGVIDCHGLDKSRRRRRCTVSREKIPNTEPFFVILARTNAGGRDQGSHVSLCQRSRKSLADGLERTPKGGDNVDRHVGFDEHPLSHAVAEVDRAGVGAGANHRTRITKIIIFTKPNTRRHCATARAHQWSISRVAVYRVTAVVARAFKCRRP